MTFTIHIFTFALFCLFFYLCGCATESILGYIFGGIEK